MEEALVDRAKAGDHTAFARLVEPYRRELHAYCYRMSGSLHDAEELLQESLLRAWKGLALFEGRASVRTWIYRIAANVCIDALEARRPRTLPMEAGRAVASIELVGNPELDPIWVEPCPAETYAASSSPEARYTQREAVALAFLVALQLLPAKQRAALILRDVVGLQAHECADVLGLSRAAVKSALQRARETLASRPFAAGDPSSVDPPTRALLVRYMAAWESADADLLVSLLHEDVTLSMPPFAEWLAGIGAVARAVDLRVFKGDARHGLKMVPTVANGFPAFAVYFRDPESSDLLARGIQLVELRDGRVASIVQFIDGSLVKFFDVVH